MKLLLGVFAIGAVFSSSPAFAYRSIHECMSVTPVGSASVSQPGFAQRMRSLRSQCAAMEQRYEAADIIWDNSDRAYVCMVGSFCQSSGE